MAWRLQKVEEQRKILAQAYWLRTTSMSELCKQFRISQKTAYKWCDRYKRLGDNGLKDLSKSPHNPNKLYSDEVINMAIDLKFKKRTWAKKNYSHTNPTTSKDGLALTNTVI